MRIKPEDKEAMLELVKEEIEKHRFDPDYNLSTSKDLASLLRCSLFSVNRYLKELGNDLKEERARVICSQVGNESARRGVGVHGTDPNTGESYRSIGGKKSMNQNWDNPNFVEKQKDNLQTIHGYRNDIGFNAQSCMEANLARIFMYCGRVFETGVPFNLDYNGTQTRDFMDFSVIKPGHQERLYEIMVHPFEENGDPTGYDKIRMFKQQYPDCTLITVTPKYYKRLERYFKDRINSDKRFVGWENVGFNLKTHPDLFG